MAQGEREREREGGSKREDGSKVEEISNTITAHQ